MKLVSFTVENYRSITQAHNLKLEQSTVLVGPNNEGKSNVLKALVVAMQVLTSGRVQFRAGRVQQFFLSTGSYKPTFPI
jgi:putative ATP-dependent endonuclease of the OLD family